MVNLRKPKTILKFDRPASWWGALWREALPMGNGIIGASVLGGAVNDTVMLTHAGLKWQGNISVLPDISDKLKDIRKLLDSGSYKQAEELYPNALISKNYRPATAVPLPLCDLKINMPTEKPLKDYMRVLNMENGECSVVYKDGATKIDRSMFVSRSSDYFILEINKSGSGLIDVEFSLDLHDRKNNRTPLSVSKLPSEVMLKYEPYFMYFSARNDNGTEFGAVAKVSHYGGTQEVTDKSIIIKGANNVLLLVKVFIESQREKEWKAAKAELAANKLNYDKMLKAHSLLHSKLMSAAELDFNADNREKGIEPLLHECYTEGISATLLEKLWHFGRYLFVSATTNSGNIILNPYGLWCGDYKAPDAEPSLLSNLALLYSHALEGGLAEHALPLINYYEGVISDLKKNALRLYNCKGIFVPAVTSPGTGMLGSVDARDIYFVAGAAIVAGVFYNYYQYTGDKKFLKDRAMPFMREAANFYEDFLKIGDDGYYFTSPSYSPNGTPGNLYDANPLNNTYIARNSEIDFSSIKQLLLSLIDGSAMSGLYKDEVVKWQDMLSKIPALKISGTGIINEYNTNEFSTTLAAGAAAQLYSVFSGGADLCGMDADCKKAALNTVKRRIAEGSTTLKSYVLAYLAGVSARLSEAELTLDIIESVVKSSAMGNLVTAANDWRGMGSTDSEHWAPYQMQGNIALTSAITAMFVQSSGNTISIMPALPGTLRACSISGIMTGSGCEISVSVDRRKGNASISIKAKKACTVDILLPEYTKRVAKGPVTIFGDDFILKDVKLAASKAAIFELKI